MGTWEKTGCVLCAQNCGLEMLIQENRIEKVRPDKENPRSEGYTCRKGLNVAHHQHHADRLIHPLKRVGGELKPIPWDQALDEIAALGELPPDNARVWYRLAVAYEACDRRDLALAALETALAAGYSAADVESDPELLALRQDVRYHRLVMRLQADA